MIVVPDVEIGTRLGCLTSVPVVLLPRELMVLGCLVSSRGTPCSIFGWQTPCLWCSKKIQGAELLAARYSAICGLFHGTVLEVSNHGECTVSTEHLWLAGGASAPYLTQCIA